MEILDINDPDFAEKLKAALGVKDGETFTIIGPQFDRTDELEVPLPLMDFAKLPELSEATLKQIGCQKWDKPNKDGEVLWLYPAEWYSHIPNGTPVTDISGCHETFEYGKTDDDRRFGALAYGFLRSKA